MAWTESRLIANRPEEGDESGDSLVGVHRVLEERLARFNAGLVSMHWTLGAYDMVAIVEAGDDETVAGVALSMAQSEGVRTTTMRSFGMAEMRGGPRAGPAEAAERAGGSATVAEVNYRCHYR
jgi:hypothetical protein